jgi:hypothetical protein
MNTRRGHVTELLAALALSAAMTLTAGGCGATARSYSSAVSAQEECCGELADAAARDECRASIRRVDGEAAASSEVNRQTFECVERYFECDPTTGRATRESAQAQLDCIDDLGDRPSS